MRRADGDHTAPVLGAPWIEADERFDVCMCEPRAHNMPGPALVHTQAR